MDGGGARAGDRRACARRGRGGRRPAAAGLALARDAPRHAQHGPEPDPRDLPRRPPVVVQDPARDLLDPGDRRRRDRLHRLGRHELLRDRSRRQRALALRHRRDHRRRRRARPRLEQRRVPDHDRLRRRDALPAAQLEPASSRRPSGPAGPTAPRLQPATGQLVNWWEGNVAYGPDSNLYVGNTGGGAYSLTPDGQQRWITQRANSVWTTPAFDAAGNSYWGSVDFYAFSLDPAGNQRWQTFTPGYLTSSPALGSDGTVYIGSFDRCAARARPGDRRRALGVPDRRPHLQLAGARLRRRRQHDRDLHRLGRRLGLRGRARRHISSGATTPATRCAPRR